MPTYIYFDRMSANSKAKSRPLNSSASTLTRWFFVCVKDSIRFVTNDKDSFFFFFFYLVQIVNPLVYWNQNNFSRHYKSAEGYFSHEYEYKTFQ